jgi:hypothetical protein
MRFHPSPCKQALSSRVLNILGFGMATSFAHLSTHDGETKHGGIYSRPSRFAYVGKARDLLTSPCRTHGLFSALGNCTAVNHKQDFELRFPLFNLSQPQIGKIELQHVKSSNGHAASIVQFKNGTSRSKNDVHALQGTFNVASRSLCIGAFLSASARFSRSADALRSNDSISSRLRECRGTAEGCHFPEN